MSELRLLKDKILADGRIENNEVEMIRHELYGNGQVDKEDVDVLIELRREARSVTPSFEELFFEAIGNMVLSDGVIDAEEAGWLRNVLFSGRLSLQGRLCGSEEGPWLRQLLFADGIIDETERNFLMKLNRKAMAVSPEFLRLLFNLSVPSA